MCNKVFFYRVVLFINFVLPLCVGGSLFLNEKQKNTNKYRKELNKNSAVHSQKENVFVLQGIFFQSDTGYWIVWIDNQECVCASPFFQGWEIIEVKYDSVVMRSLKNPSQRRTLFVCTEDEERKTSRKMNKRELEDVSDTEKSCKMLEEEKYDKKENLAAPEEK